MDKQKYDIQKIKDYLLGSLPEAQAERFDELSFTDDEFADTLNSIESDLVDAYVRGELSGAELEKFETFYLATPLRREKVEFAKAFQIYGEEKITKLENSDAAASKPKRAYEGIFSALNMFSPFRPAPQMAFAAVLLAVIIFGGWFLISRSNRQTNEILVKQDPTPQSRQETNSYIQPTPSPEIESEIAQTNANVESLPPQITKKEPQQKNAEKPVQRQPSPPKISIASFILTPPLRGGGQIQSVSVPENTDFVSVTLELESDDFAAYSAALTDQSGKNLWRGGTIKARKRGEGKALNVRFPAKLLRPQIYSMVVSGVGADGESEIISNYPFRVVLK